ncbi:MAG: YeeE/YedE family protein [Candidatus Devosia euplotis]|nr:YeeE/YedE family protein [Candidatus Devosia euplotis]
MESFTPLTAALGGSLIGLATAVLRLGNGRIAGISGIFGQLLPPAQTVVWRLVFLLAMVISTFVVARLLPDIGMGENVPAKLTDAPAAWGIATPVWLAIAGLLACLNAHLSPCWCFFGVAMATVAVTGVV